MKYFKITDRFKFATEKTEIREAETAKTGFNKNPTMNLLFCQKKHACFISISINVIIGFG